MSQGKEEEGIQSTVLECTFVLENTRKPQDSPGRNYWSLLQCSADGREFIGFENRSSRSSIALLIL